MNLNIDEEKYNTSKEKIDAESYIIKVETKKKQCSVCKKLFEAKKRNALHWTDDNGFYRIGYFCREHYRLVRKVLIAEKVKELD